MTDIELPRLYERDIDVLLQEELIFNEHVRLLFSRALQLVSPIQIDSCGLSIVDETGETDIFAVFNCDARKGVLLIENKIDAAFQPRQPERYKERMLSLMANDNTLMAFCILVAPGAYRGGNAEEFMHFNAIVSYEDIAGAIRMENVKRSQHRASLLLRAIEQARSSYVLAPVEAVTDLWDRIYKMARSDFPELQMKVPGEKGSHSNWVIFKANLPPRITIDWKIGRATVELSFWRYVKNIPTTINLSLLPQGTTTAKLGETTAIQVPLDPPPTNWTEISHAQIKSALEGARKLLQFYKENSSQF